MKKIILPLLFSFSLPCLADNALLVFRQDNPDVILQLKLNESNRNYIFNQVREMVKLTQGIDILDTGVELPELPPISEGLNLEEYIDKKLAKLLKDSLNFSLKQVSTTLDIYKLSYKLGHPILTLNSTIQNQDSIDLIVDFKSRKLEIEVENIYVNNHSPGVKVTNQDPVDGKVRITGKEHMTLIDDIYLKLVSPDDKPLVSVETNENQPAVASGQIRIRIKKQGATMALEYVSHDFKLFEGKDVTPLADNIKVYLSKDSKIGGIDAIEFGRTELKLKNNINDLINKKRVFITNLIANPIAEEIKNSDLTKYFIDEINKVKINDSRLTPLATTGNLAGLSMTTQINTVGILNRDNQEEQQLLISTNNSLSWVNNAFIPQDVLPFPMSQSPLHQVSKDKITSEIESGKADAIVSLGQDHLNHLIYNITKGHIDLPNDPTTKQDDMIKNGKKGVFMILEDPTAPQGKIIVDIMIKPKFFTALGFAIATFRTKFYFPLVLLPEVTVEMKNKTPELVMRLKDIDMSEETLRQGLYGVQSNLNKGISRKLVIKKIRQQLKPMIGTELYRIPLKNLEGIDPTTIASLSSDGTGRLNLKIVLNGRNKEVQTLAEMLPKLLHRALTKK